MLKNQTYFFADTTVNIDPTAEDARRDRDRSRPTPCARFDVEPRIAMISFSNFGSNTHAAAR